MAEKKPKSTKSAKVETSAKSTKVETSAKSEKGDKSDKSPKAKPLTKSEVLQQLAEKTGLAKKQVSEVFEALTELIRKELGNKKGSGLFTIPGLLKLRVVRKPATKATMRPNPFKPGEMMEVKAKPAKNTVRARPLKTLNELI